MAPSSSSENERAREYERLFALSLDMLCIANFEGRFHRVNPAFERLLGLPMEALERKPFLEFVHPDDREATLRELGNLTDGTPTISFENRYRAADGGYRWLAWRAQPVIAEGLIYAVARDVTEARAAAAALADREARLRGIFECSVDPIVTIDEGGVIESCNRACEELFRTTREALVGRNVNVLMPEPYRSEHGSYLARYLRTGEAHIIGRGQREVIGLRADGSTFPLELGVTELRLSDRRLFLGILRDVSHRKAAEAERATLLTREANERGRLEVASGILHDVGNALTGIVTKATEARGALARADAPRELQRAARFVRAQQGPLEAALGPARGAALADLVEGLERAFASLHAGVRDELETLAIYVVHAQDLLATYRAWSRAGSAPRDVAASVATLLADAQVMAGDAVRAAGGQLEVQASADALTERVGAELLRAILNAIHNAVDAWTSSPGPEALRVVVRVTRDERHRLWVAVADNGPGFEGDGERFFADGVTTRARASGIGLGLVRRAVTSLGGAVTLASAGPRLGAELTICLPSRSTV